MFIRIAESRSVMDGDVGILRINDGTLQGIESDLIADPVDDNGKPPDITARWTNGVKTTRSGRATHFALHRRGEKGRGYRFDRVVSAKNFHLLGYFNRFSQFRGVSPFAPGITSLVDVYEGIDYGLARLKIEQLMALAISRDNSTPFPRPPGTDEEDVDAEEATGYRVDFGKGPALLDLDPGDKAEFLTTGNPSANTREFLMAVIMVALKALDIPYSFFDENHTNFFGSRAAWIHYDRSCVIKRNRLIRLQDEWLKWRILYEAVHNGFRIPRSLSFDRPWWVFTPLGVPWWNPLQEVATSLKAIAAGLDTPQAVVKRHGMGTGDFNQNVRDIGLAIKAGRANGVTLSFDNFDVKRADDIDA